MDHTGTTTIPSEELEHILERIDRLCPLPESAASLLQNLDHPGTTVEDVTTLLTLDPVLTAFVLQTANAIYSTNGKVNIPLSEALAHLDNVQLRTFMYCASAAKPLTLRLRGYRLDEGKLWNHSVTTATIACQIARMLSYPALEEVYAAGLLHDLGKMLLNDYLTANYSTIVDKMWKHKLFLWQAETQLFGVNHAELSGLIAARWALPDGLVDAIRYHHSPALARSAPPLAAIIHVANALTPQDFLGLSSLGRRMILPEALRVLDLTMPALEQMRVAVPKSLADQPTVPIPTRLLGDLHPGK